MTHMLQPKQFHFTFALRNDDWWILITDATLKKHSSLGNTEIFFCSILVYDSNRSRACHRTNFFISQSHFKTEAFLCTLRAIFTTFERGYMRVLSACPDDFGITGAANRRIHGPRT